MDIDLARLAHGNKLGQEIAQKMGYKKTKYWQFLQDHCFTTIHPDVAPLIHDILYAKEILSHMCEKYQNLIFRETNKTLRHMTDEEKLSVGYEAIWKGLHAYTNSKTTITIWLMFGIRMYAAKNRKVRGIEFTISETVSEFLEDAKQPKPDITLNEEEILELWQRKIGIRGENKIMFDFFMTKEAYRKEGWIRSYIADFRARTGKTVSKPAILLRMVSIRKRLANYLRTQGVEMPLAS